MLLEIKNLEKEIQNKNILLENLTFKEKEITHKINLKHFFLKKEYFDMIDYIGIYMNISDTPFFCGRMVSLLHYIISYEKINNLNDIKIALQHFENNNKKHMLLFKKLSGNLIKQKHIDFHFENFYKSFNNRYNIETINDYLIEPIKYKNANHIDINEKTNFEIFKNFLEILITDYNLKSKEEIINIIKYNYYKLNSLKMVEFKNKHSKNSLLLNILFSFSYKRLI